MARMEFLCAKLSASVNLYEQTVCYQEENWGKPEKPPWLVCNEQAGVISVTDICPSEISWLDSCMLCAPIGSKQLLPDIVIYQIKGNPGISSSWS